MVVKISVSLQNLASHSSGTNGLEPLSLFGARLHLKTTFDDVPRLFAPSRTLETFTKV